MAELVDCIENQALFYYHIKQGIWKFTVPCFSQAILRVKGSVGGRWILEFLVWSRCPGTIVLETVL
jgi:hypothetical protein